MAIIWWGPLFASQAAGWGCFNSFGVFFKPLTDAFGWSRAAIAGATSASFCIYGVFSILAGRLNDKMGPRRVMTISGLFLGMGYLLLARMENLWQLYLFYGLLVGFGVSGTDVVLLSTIARWFIRLRGRMSGFLKVGTGVGMMTVPIVGDWLINAFGWRWAMAVLGILILTVFLTLSQLLLRDPALRGLSPDGDRTPVVKDRTIPEEGIDLAPALKTLRLWLMCLAYFIILTCTMTILLHIVPHAIDLGIDKSRAAQLLSFIGAFSVMGRFAMGYASDALGSRWALVICFCLLTASLAWLPVAGRLWMLLCFGVVYGFAHGGFFAVMSPLVAEFFGTRDHGALLGLLIFTSTLGGSTGPVTAGYVFDTFGSYKLVFFALPVLSAIGLVVAFLLPRPCGYGNKPQCPKGAGV